jgi:hypothetical protein
MPTQNPRNHVVSSIIGSTPHPPGPFRVLAWGPHPARDPRLCGFREGPLGQYPPRPERAHGLLAGAGQEGPHPMKRGAGALFRIAPGACTRLLPA